MKNVLLAIVLLVSGAISASAASLNLGGDFAVSFSTSLSDTYVIGAYDFVNKRPLAGYGKEVLHFSKGATQFAYLSGRHMFDASQNGRGQFGVALGANIGALGQKVADLTGKAGEVVPMPSWIAKTANFVSIEVGGGYWPEPIPETKPWSWDVGGKIRIPVDSFFGLFQSK